MKELITQEDIKDESQQAVKAVEDANNLVISNQDEMKIATEMLSQVNKIGDSIKEKKDAVIKPINAGVKALRALFKPVEENRDEAVSIIKNKMVDYQTKIEEENKIKEERIEKRVEKGTMKAETAVNKLEEMPEIENKVESDIGSVNFKTIRKVEIIDESLLPREYLMPNDKKIKEEALAFDKLGKDQISGVKVIEEKTVANAR